MSVVYLHGGRFRSVPSNLLRFYSSSTSRYQNIFQWCLKWHGWYLSHVVCSLLFLTSEHKQTLFYWEGGQTLEQLAQTGCGVSHLSIYGPGQPAVNDPADWAGGLDYMISKGPPQPKWWQVFVYCAVFYAGRRVAWVLILHFVGMHFRKERRERCSLHME